MLIVLAIIGIIMIVNFVDKVDFSRTKLEGIVWIDGNSVEKPASFASVHSNFNNLSSSSNPPRIPIYFVEGYNASYMRTTVYNSYRDGVWYDENRYGDFQGFDGKIYKVTPIVPFEGHIPVYKGTVMVTVKSAYNSSSNTFKVNRVNVSYYGFVRVENFKPTELADDEHSKIDVPCLDEVRELTLKVVGDSEGYEKVKRIENFLKSNYSYSFDYNPKGDPICWFIFDGKRGICKHFASAFVVMCESIGIPARVVEGYRVKPTEENQTVFGDQAHMWAEVKFKEGWVEFDPTPLSLVEKIPTVVKIDRVDERVVEGEYIHIEGSVTGESGFVEIYLKRDKRERGILLGLAEVKKGRFNSSFKVLNVTGKYHVVAHFVGSLKYAESWSDPTVEIYERPKIHLNLPDKIPRKYVVRGKIECRELPAYINIYVDGEIYRSTKTDDRGNFEFELNLTDGFHNISIRYDGGRYILPITFNTTVEVGDVEMWLSNYTVIVGRESEIEVCAFFNKRPVNFTFNGREFRCNETLRIRSDKVGYIKLTFNVCGFKKEVYLKSVAETFIEYRFTDNRTIITVRDSMGNRLNGVVYVNGKPYVLKNGCVEVSYEEGFAYYPGDEFHLPSSVEFRKPSLLPLIFPTIFIAGYFIYRAYCRLDVRFLKEFKDLPNIWKVGEEVRFEVKSFRDWRVNGIKTKKLIFDKPGEYDLVFENGKVRKVFRIKIVEDYGDAIAEVFKSYCDDFKTAREVFGDRGCVRIFEDYVYGGKRGFTRNDFLRVFDEVRSCLAGS